MLQFVDLGLGLGAWGILLFLVISKKSSEKHRGRLRLISWILCAVALYLPTLSQYLEFRVKDYDSVIDCASTYHFLSAVLLAGTTLLTLLSILVQKRRNRR